MFCDTYTQRQNNPLRIFPDFFFVNDDSPCAMCICLCPIPLTEIWELSIFDKIQKYGIMLGKFKIRSWWPKSRMF